MAKSLLRSITFFALFLVLSPSAKAQSYEYGRYIQTITHTIRIPEDGSLDEALKVSAEWGQAVLKKHSKIISVRYLLSQEEEGSDTHKLLVLYEYENSEAAKNTGAEIQELIQKHWTTDASRNAFFARLRKYINPAENVRGGYAEVKI